MITSLRRSFQLSPYAGQSNCDRSLGFAMLYLAAGRLSEPESPLVLKRVLHVEVILVVEDRDRLAIGLGLAILLLAVGGHRDRGQVDLLVHTT